MLQPHNVRTPFDRTIEHADFARNVPTVSEKLLTLAQAVLIEYSSTVRFMHVPHESTNFPKAVTTGHSVVAHSVLLFHCPMKEEGRKLSLCLTNQALHHEGVWETGCIN
jgi:hypothetical protein